MKKMSSLVWLLALTACLFSGGHSDTSDLNPCVGSNEGWFGKRCQYKCHCNSTCGPDGECSGSGCQVGWFGPKCQYSDLSQKMVGKHSQNLKDEDPTTCITISDKNVNLKFEANGSMHFEWMRLIGSDNGNLDDLKIIFKDDSDNFDQTPLQRVRVSRNTVDIYRTLQRKVKVIRFRSETAGVITLCSVHISGGRNVALRQNAIQSSSYFEGNEEYKGQASNAVDGNTVSRFLSSSCTHTKSETDPWWTLRMDRPVQIYAYKIYNRAAHACRLKYFKLIENNTDPAITSRSPYNGDAEVESVYSIEYPDADGSNVTSVTIELSTDYWSSDSVCNNEEKAILTLCEVEMYGDVLCEPGQWGLECDQKCNCENITESCYVSTGMCPSGCRAGYHGPGCKTQCEVGSYGDGCLKNCSGNCKDTCNHVNGSCSCYPGYKGELCNKECETGSYGDGCLKNCSGNCKDTCNHVNGSCSCKPGYKGELCNNECETGFYGDGCLKYCSGNCKDTCNHVNGSCSCKPGYKGELCNKECETGSYGDGCLKNCSGNCKDTCNHVNGSCSCKPGYKGELCYKECEAGSYGDGCLKYCSGNCKDTCNHVNGSCSCKPGYKGELCNQACETGSYGDGCLKNCSENCNDTCNNVNGSCSCNPGYKGKLCNKECETGSYGDGCLKNCSGNCKDTCNHVNGSCSCKPGYKGELCYKECEAGSYGDGCLKYCSGNCKDTCNHVNGSCSCKPGYKGELCNQACETGSYGDGCLKNCSENCNDTCNNVNGSCSCNPGYKGKLCNKECEAGSYGDGCQKNCSGNCKDTCNHVIGSCSCKPGYKGETCNQECEVGSYGDECRERCSGNCEDRCNHVNGSCSCKAGYKGELCNKECEAGSYGDGCLKNCSGNCKDTCNHVNGSCSCKPGYKGKLCNKECEVGSYGDECRERCSGNCEDRCNHVNGSCSCKAGYKGELCNKECEAGSYGDGCLKNCSGNCKDTCNHVNGSCSCKPGYKGKLCNKECKNNSFGQDCIHTCSAHCLEDVNKQPSVCNHVSGQCLLGCKEGRTGITCEKTVASDHSALYAIPAVLVVVLALVILLGFFLLRRHQKRALTKDKTSGSMEALEHKPKISTASYPEEQAGSMSYQALINKDEGKKTKSKNENSRLLKLEESVTESTDANNEPIYCNTASATSETRIPVSELGAVLASKNIDYFKEQFSKIPNSQAATNTAQSAENKARNRYKNILPFDHSRVYLQANPSKKQGDYYNASFIGGYKERFIAAQAPNKVMLNDFIRLLWEHQVSVVVMLTKLVEEGKTKCEMYWPEEGEMKFGEITVRLAATQMLADYTVRTLQLTKEDQQPRVLTQFHFTSWPDKGVPETPWALVDFEQVVNTYTTEHPILVHCSAGVGRTGTFIALRNVMKEARATGSIDFYLTLCNLRQDRVFMVQTAEQYHFLHEAAQVALLCQDALVTTNDFSDRMEVLTQRAPSGETNVEREFREVCNLCLRKGSSGSGHGPEEDRDIYASGYAECNQNKNRYPNILPKESFRPYIAADIKDQGDYINAVMVPSMSKLCHQILTQLPLPTTVADFWRLVTQYDVSLIVAFDLDSGTPDMGDYLPANSTEPIVCGQFEISRDKVTTGNLWEKQKLKVVTEVMKKTGMSAPTVHIVENHVNHLSPTKTDMDAQDWLEFISEARSMAPPGDRRILYMCRNGADLCGFACVLSLLLNRVDHDHFLTVPLVVGEIKSIRPQVIPTKDQYRLLYEVLLLHHEASHIYMNHLPNIGHNTHEHPESKKPPPTLAKPRNSLKDTTKAVVHGEYDAANSQSTATALNHAAPNSKDIPKAAHRDHTMRENDPSVYIKMSAKKNIKTSPDVDFANVYANSRELTS